MSQPPIDLVITRHGGLLEYLLEEGIVPPGVEVVSRATPKTVRGRHTLGALPLWLAAHSASHTEIPMRIPPALRGVELTAEQTREFAGLPARYRVERVPLDG